MAKLASIVTLTALVAATSAMAETAIADLRGTWKGQSETIILGTGNTHHDATTTAEPRLNSVAFTMTIDQQDGRRFSGTFSSARGSEKVIAVVSRTGAIYMVDDDGHDIGSMLAPNRMELCYLKQSPVSRIASCTELTKEP
jgi:tRNA pseudouridine-54 N-methylase